MNESIMAIEVLIKLLEAIP